MATSERSKRSKFQVKKLIVPGVVMFAFWSLAVALWRTSGYIQPLILFGYIGTSLGVGLGLYAALPKKKKQTGRKLTLFLIGGALLVFMGLLQSENMQIEWVFFSILAGIGGGALTHYLIAKIFGPILFGRLWCGWACWTLMILDLLPHPRSKGRIPGKWGWLRYAHFALSLGLVLILWFGFNYQEHIYFGSVTGMYWMIVGNALYYLVGISLAFILKDNRAFCKYVCPITVFLKTTCRFSLLKVEGDREKCTECGTCVRVCPMDIRVMDYTQDGQRVLSTECTVCQTCVTACPSDALKLSFGFDLGGKELLREREQTAERVTT
jgi:ferredoxin-type protein NapH